MTSPSDYRPETFKDLIGPSRQIGEILLSKCEALKESKSPFKVLLFGVPGVGKSELIKMIAVRLTGLPVDRFGNSFATETMNGKNVSSDTVRRWIEEAHYRPMYPYRVKCVNEIDQMHEASQVLLLDFLDGMGDSTAFLGTSNLQLMALSERFETRLQQFKVSAPTTEQIAKFLQKNWGFSKAEAMRIAVGSGGNCRAALLDAQSILDVQRIAA